jgi:hypothetical protein
MEWPKGGNLLGITLFRGAGLGAPGQGLLSISTPLPSGESRGEGMLSRRGVISAISLFYIEFYFIKSFHILFHI